MRNTKGQLEVIVLDVKDAVQAEAFGVDRLELLTALDKGGLTPSIEVIKKVAAAVQIPVYVMLRNLWETFIYDEIEFAKILEQIELIKKTEAKGIVFGSLNLDKTINEEQLQVVIATKGNLELTFGRAIDEVANYKQAVEMLDKFSQVDYVLTSGQAKTAMEGKVKLSLAANILKEKIILGSGVGPANCASLMEIPYAKKLHVGSSVRINHDIFDELESNPINLIKEAINNKS